MGSREMLQELAREVRQSTLQILAAARPDWLTFSPPPTSNHILWHAGHALWLQDVMCVQPLDGDSELPAGWAERFGMHSHPASVSVWPDRGEVQQLLEAQMRRILKLLGDVSPDQLSQPARNLGGRRSLAGWIIHGLHDEAKHSGEMYLLWKLCRLQQERSGNKG
jgi:hypothetical protein